MQHNRDATDADALADSNAATLLKVEIRVRLPESDVKDVKYKLYIKKSAFIMYVPMYVCVYVAMYTYTQHLLKYLCLATFLYNH